MYIKHKIRKGFSGVLATMICLQCTSNVYAISIYPNNRSFFLAHMKNIEYYTASGNKELRNAGDLLMQTGAPKSFKALYDIFANPNSKPQISKLYDSPDQNTRKPYFSNTSSFAVMIGENAGTSHELSDKFIVNNRYAQIGTYNIFDTVTLDLKGGLSVENGGLLLQNTFGGSVTSAQKQKIVVQLGAPAEVGKNGRFILDGTSNVGSDTVGSPASKLIAPKGQNAIVVKNGGDVEIANFEINRSINDNSESALINVEDGGNLRFFASGLMRFDKNTGMPTYVEGSENPDVKAILNNGTSSGAAVKMENGATVAVEAGDFTASGTGAIFELSDGATINLEGGSIVSASEAPAITVDSGATIIIPEDSKAEIKSEGGNVAVDLAGGSKVQQGNNAITVASDKDDSASNYVDNYGNLVLQNGSDDGTVAPNTVIQPNGTTITGNDTLPNVNDDGSVSIPTGGATVTNPEGEKVEVGSGEMPTIVIGVKDQSGHVETSKTIDLNSGPLTLETVVFGNPIDLETYTCNVASDKSNIANATLNNDHKIVVTPVSVGEAVITATYTNNDTKASLKATFNVKVTTTSSGGGGGGGGSSSGGDSTSGTQFVKNAVYRAYNPNSGEHFYTPNYDEFKYITNIGWNDEGIACVTETKTNGHTLYRLYNPNSGLHHYTLDENEKNVLVSLGWNDEDVAWYTSKNTNDPAVYRLYNLNDGQHHYTMDVKERDALVKLGWTYEGVGYHTSPIKK